MATRRFRIKAVANVAVSRGRCTEKPQDNRLNENSSSNSSDRSDTPSFCQEEAVVPAESIGQKSCLEKSPDLSSIKITTDATDSQLAVKTDTISAPIVVENSANGSSFTANNLDSHLAPNSVLDFQGSNDCGSSDISSGCNENGATDVLVSTPTETEGSLSSAKNTVSPVTNEQSIGTSGDNVSSAPIKLPRKRMKPMVCVSAVNRRARESAATETDIEYSTKRIREKSSGPVKKCQKLEESSDIQTDVSVMTVATDEHCQAERSDLCDDSQKTFEPSTVVETPVSETVVCDITRESQRIASDKVDSGQPIGDPYTSAVSASRTDSQKCTDSEVTSTDKCGETSHSKSDSISGSVKSSGQINSFRSRFIRPKPRLIDSASRHNRNSGTGSASESDSEKKSLSSATTVSPPWQPRLSASRPRSNRMPVFESKHNNIHGSGTSADESEDDISVISKAATISPPKKIAKLDSDCGSDASHSEFSSDLMELEASPVKKTSSKPERTTKRKEYFRRIVEIKKEILHKVSDGKVNKSRLTMFDLIYYNPVTNPMKSSPEIGVKKCGPPPSNTTESEDRLAEEAVDEPEAEIVDDGEQSSSLPVPQVKVGPNGEIILDEQSLVIETTDAKKNWNDLQNSQVIMDYGSGTTTFNAYSKKKKSRTKDWSREETIRFYRALHTVGTDFLVMQSLFPKFTRKDLKDRFKKEERINRALVEKALRNPLTFDLTDLKKEFEQERLEEERMPVPSKKAEQPKQPRKSNRRSYSLYATLNSTDQGKVRSRKGTGRPKSKANTSKRREEAKKSKENHRKVTEKADSATALSVCVSESAGKSVESGPANSESSTGEIIDVTKLPKPTRSGRIPRPRIFDDFMTDDLEEIIEETEITEICDSVTVEDICEEVSVEDTGGDLVSVEDINESEQEIPLLSENSAVGEDASTLCESEEEESVPRQNYVIAEDALTVHQNHVNLGSIYASAKPGTLIVLATESPDNPGHQVYRVFMVSNNSETLPVSVSNNHSASADDTSNNGEAVNSTDPTVVENNTNDCNNLKMSAESSS